MSECKSGIPYFSTLNSQELYPPFTNTADSTVLSGLKLGVIVFGMTSGKPSKPKQNAKLDDLFLFCFR